MGGQCNGAQSLLFLSCIELCCYTDGFILGEMKGALVTLEG